MFEVVLVRRVEVLRMLILPNHQQTQFSNILGRVFFFFCTKRQLVLQGLSGITHAFVLCVHSERRVRNRLELWCGISKQLLHE